MAMTWLVVMIIGTIINIICVVIHITCFKMRSIIVAIDKEAIRKKNELNQLKCDKYDQTIIE